MFGFIKKFFKKVGRAIAAFSDEELPTFSSMDATISRERLKRNCRILFIDDEKVDLVDDLENEGFSVTQDYTGEDTVKIERGYFDLVILDYKGVGRKYGKDDGLALLKAIKRVNPSVFVLAYTSQNLSPNQSSEFYTLSDGSLNKDEGVANSISRIESALREARDPGRLWSGVLKSLDIPDGSEKAKKLERRVVRAVLSSKREEALAALGENVGPAETLVTALVEKLMDFAVSSLVGCS